MPASSEPTFKPTKRYIIGMTPALIRFPMLPAGSRVLSRKPPARIMPSTPMMTKLRPEKDSVIFKRVLLMLSFGFAR
jgi:hypothetical protein